MARRAQIYYKIGEVCELTKTEPYVLRYWESEFPFLAPEKNRAGQRIYSEEDIQTVLAIKRLLYEEGYTTAGARRRLEKELAERREGGAAPAQGPEAGAPEAVPRSSRGASTKPTAGPHLVEAGAPAAEEVKAALRQVRDGLREIRDLLAPAPKKGKRK